MISTMNSSKVTIAVCKGKVSQRKVAATIGLVTPRKTIRDEKYAEALLANASASPRLSGL